MQLEKVNESFKQKQDYIEFIDDKYDMDYGTRIIYHNHEFLICTMLYCYHDYKYIIDSIVCELYINNEDSRDKSLKYVCDICNECYHPYYIRSEYISCCNHCIPTFLTNTKCYNNIPFVSDHIKNKFYSFISKDVVLMHIWKFINDTQIEPIVIKITPTTLYNPYKHEFIEFMAKKLSEKAIIMYEFIPIKDVQRLIMNNLYILSTI
jgi:hypothetical protein